MNTGRDNASDDERAVHAEVGGQCHQCGEAVGDLLEHLVKVHGWWRS